MKPFLVGPLLIGVTIACLLVAGQARFDKSTFEFGVYREYQGSLEAWPYAMLLTKDARYLLVGQGKHGVDMDSQSGNRVSLRGALIQNGDDRMLEVLPGSVRTIMGEPAQDATVDLGPVTLRGEIVDSKCYLGVMNPGRGKVHRDCAVRCISGGVPPAFLVRDAHGDARVMLLARADGSRLGKELLPFVAEPVEITGRLVRKGSTLILRADLTSLHRE